MLSQQLNPNFTALENKTFSNGLLLLFISRYKRLTLSLLVPSWRALPQFSPTQERLGYFTTAFTCSFFFASLCWFFLSISRFVYKRIACLLKFLFFIFPSPNIQQQKPNAIKSNTHSFVLLRCEESLLIRKSKKTKFSCRMMGVSFLNSDNSWEILGKYVLAKIHSASDMLWINISVSCLPRGVLLFLSPASDLRTEECKYVCLGFFPVESTISC